MTLSKDIRKDFGQRLGMYLKTKGVSQDELAMLSGVSRQTVNNIINGKTPASSDLLAKLSSSYLDLNINWLLTGKGHMLIGDDKPALHVPRHSYTFESLLELLDSKEETIELLKAQVEALKETIALQKEVIESKKQIEP